MAQPNYQFQKRQRDLAKKARKQEKLLRKKAAKDGQNPDAAGDTPITPAPDSAQ